jgi:rubrerythrin
MTVDELIKKLDEAIITEENAVVLYAGHLKAVMEWSGLAKKEMAEVKSVLDVLIEESQIHGEILKSMKDELEKDGGLVQEG